MVWHSKLHSNILTAPRRKCSSIIKLFCGLLISLNNWLNEVSWPTDWMWVGSFKYQSIGTNGWITRPINSWTYSEWSIYSEWGIRAMQTRRELCYNVWRHHDSFTSQSHYGVYCDITYVTWLACRYHVTERFIYIQCPVAMIGVSIHNWLASDVTSVRHCIAIATVMQESKRGIP